MGKVGTEDPSFILPVSQRKDGIAAMFKKQATSSSKTKQEPGNSAAKSEATQSSLIQSHFPQETKEEALPPPSALEMIDDDEDVKGARATPISPKNIDVSSPSSPILEPSVESSPKKRKSSSKSPGVASSPNKKSKKVRRVRQAVN